MDYFQDLFQKLVKNGPPDVNQSIKDPFRESVARIQKEILEAEEKIRFSRVLLALEGNPHWNTLRATLAEFEDAQVQGLAVRRMSKSEAAFLQGRIDAARKLLKPPIASVKEIEEVESNVIPGLRAQLEECRRLLGTSRNPTHEWQQPSADRD